MPASPRPRAETSEAGDGRRMVQLYVPKDLRVQIQQFQEEQRLTTAELVLTAIEQAHSTLDLGQSTRSSGLFSRSYRAKRSPYADLIQVGVRLRVDDIAQIDHLVSAAHMSSRSAYIVAALKAFLVARIPQEDA